MYASRAVRGSLRGTVARGVARAPGRVPAVRRPAQDQHGDVVAAYAAGELRQVGLEGLEDLIGLRPAQGEPLVERVEGTGASRASVTPSV